MSAVTFDTLKFVDELEKSGIPEKQARAISSAVRNVHDSSDVATKADISDLRREMSEIKFELLKWMVGLLIGQTGLLLALLKFFPAAS
jgi:hypothetical protein